MRSEIPSQRTNITTAHSKQLEQYSNPKSSHQTTDTRSKSGGAQFSSRNSKRTKKKKKKKLQNPQETYNQHQICYSIVYSALTEEG